ncbi:disease resistance-like protein DSC1 isoform X1 [Senna tora]|uniref:Disease resistance-like protein DSC1 isoform X1 n=1 Tax=Senna tora TaxID=362788 RepID=A0A834TCD8_9FABA|nr:disease resistance-like protein DSC1 isoform X1 [Senna tora]
MLRSKMVFIILKPTPPQKDQSIFEYSPFPELPVVCPQIQDTALQPQQIDDPPQILPDPDPNLQPNQTLDSARPLQVYSRRKVPPPTSEPVQSSSSELQDVEGTETIQSIILDKLKSVGVLSLNPQVFARMHKLKFLKLTRDLRLAETDFVDLRDGLGYLPDELRLLHWHGYPQKSLPMTFSAEYLVELDLSWSKVEKLWDWDEVKLYLSGIPFKELPIGCLRKLECLNLVDCKSLTHLPSNCVELRSLRQLYVTTCIKLVSLPLLPLSIEQVMAELCISLETVQLTSINGDPLNRNMVHIFLGNNDDEMFTLDDRCSEMINERIEESRRSSHSITYIPKLSFHFLTGTGKCGVNPIYANEEKEEDEDSMVEEDIDDDSEKNEEDHEGFEEDIDDSEENEEDEDFEEDEIEAFPPTKRLK